MAVELRVKIDGMAEIRKALEKAPEKTVAAVSKAVERSMTTVWSEALKEAPVNKQSGGGTLRQKIQGRMLTKLAAVVEAKAPYSVYVHEGTRPHLIVPVNKQALANRRTGQFFGKVVHHPGTRPNPFLARAVKRSASKVQEFFREAIQGVLDAVGRSTL